MLYYCPLEPYKERYTMQWSAPVKGWLERRWVEAGVNYRRINGQQTHRRPVSEIKTGCVLDGIGRTHHCFAQIAELLDLAEAGDLTDADVIYFDDFWHPGIEALPYVFDLIGVRPRMYAFLHAQSVDEFDFTFPMRHWMRPFEQGIAAALAGIFVCCPTLRDLVVQGGIAPKQKVHITGHPFASDEVLERMPERYRKFISHTPVGCETISPRENKVIYSSRFDREKNPWFFLQVAQEVIKRVPNAKFVVCTGAKKLRSNDHTNIDLLNKAMATYPSNIFLRENLTKEDYYVELVSAKIQMNTADQDFVAITLLEASVAGCYPIYPYFRSFPETFLHKPGFMYQRLDVDHAASMVEGVLQQKGLWTNTAIKKRAWIHNRFDDSWKRMLTMMDVQTDLERTIYDFTNPYDED